MIFKKGVHIKTRYDEMKERDKQWKIETGTETGFVPIEWILKFEDLSKINSIGNYGNFTYVCGCGE